MLTIQEWKQKAFNGSYRGLRYQGFRQSTRYYLFGGGCLYRGSLPGLSVVCCGVGWLIPDEKYKPSFEGFGIEYIDCKNKEDLDPIEGLESAISDDLLPLPAPNLCLEFLKELQDSHDDGFTPEKMKKKLKSLAEEHDLKIPSN